MLKIAHKSDRQNNSKWNKFKAQRNKSTPLRRLAIRVYFYFLSRCKPGAFMIKSQQNIILKEEECIVTKSSDVCDIFATFFLPM